MCRDPSHIEDETHALLRCTAPEIAELRHNFFTRATEEHFRDLPRKRERWSDAKLLDFLLKHRGLLPMFGEYVCTILERFDGHEVWIR